MQPDLAPGEAAPLSRPRILVTRRLPDLVEARMATLFDAEFNRSDRPLTAAEIAGKLSGRQVLVSTITDRIDAGLIATLPGEVKLIAQFGNGVDNIDVDAAYRAGITVTNTPSVLTEDTADMAMALMLALPRRLVEGAVQLSSEGRWHGWSPTAMLGRRLRGRSLAIVGLGRIGTAVATRARAFGLTIHYFSRSRRPAALEERLDARFWPELEPMLAAADIVSLHTPLTRETQGILSAARINRLKPEAFVVNVSRPELIDEAALVDALQAGRLSGAALDVFEHRGGINPGLLALARNNRVILTGHMASATLEARLEMGETVIVNIRVFFDGDQPPHRVLPEEGRRQP